VKFLSRAHSEGPGAFQRSYSSFLRLLLFLTSGGAAICLGAVLLRPELLGEEFSAYRALLVPALVGVPAIVLHGFFGQVLAAAGRANAAALMLLAIAAALAGSAYVGISLAGLAGYYWGNLLTCVLIVGSVVVYLRRWLNLPVRGDGEGVRKLLRENPSIVTFGLVLYVSSGSSAFGHFMARYTVLSSFGEAEAGMLQAAIALSAAFNLVLTPANGLYLTPILNRNMPKYEKMRAAVEFQTKLMVAIGILAMPLVLFPHWALILVFSPAFVQAGQVLVLFVLAQCVLILAGVHQALMIGLDDLKVYGGIIALGHLSIGGLSWLLVPQYGIVGVAVALLIANATIFSLTLARLRSEHGLRLSPRLVVLMVYGLSVLALVGSVGYDSRDPPVLLVLGKVAFYGGFVISLALLLGRQELEWLHRQVDSLLFRDDGHGLKYAAGHAYRRIAGRFFPEA
jgi:O-antigen/teichoic acid export membrane protein